ncbi:MAG: cytochrome c [Bacteroidales bacterium]|nr:cytochrome c [Bacteroidales bacterium]
MKKLNIVAAIAISGVIFLASCGGGNQESSQTKEEPAQKEEVKASENTGLEAQLQLGEKIYKEKCIVCHQADAKGLKGAFPPLAGSDYLLADLKRAVAQTINGSNEEMIVNGEKYNAPMTPQVKTIEEGVAVINYVLKQFNGYTDDQLIKVEDVQDIEINPLDIPQQTPQQQ